MAGAPLPLNSSKHTPLRAEALSAPRKQGQLVPSFSHQVFSLHAKALKKKLMEALFHRCGPLLIKFVINAKQHAAVGDVKGTVMFLFPLFSFLLPLVSLSPPLRHLFLRVWASSGSQPLDDLDAFHCGWKWLCSSRLITMEIDRRH